MAIYDMHSMERYIVPCYKLLEVYIVLRRLEDRIRELCAKTLTAQGSAELEPIFSELTSALHEHTERLRKTAALKLVCREEDSLPERRSAGGRARDSR